MNNINLHILNASGTLTPHLKTIKEEFDMTIKKVTDKIPISNVDIMVSDDPEDSIPELGFGGYTPSAHLVYISVDPKSPQLDNSLIKEFGRLLAHELNHAMRWKNPGYGKTLLEALTTEGLADHFAMEISNLGPMIWDTALTTNQLKKVMKLAQKEFNSKNYNHFAWFLKSIDKNIPRWGGYTLGFNLVAEYLKKHPDKKPSDLYSTPAEEFKPNA